MEISVFLHPKVNTKVHKKFNSKEKKLQTNKKSRIMEKSSYILQFNIPMAVFYVDLAECYAKGTFSLNEYLTALETVTEAYSVRQKEF